MFRVLNRLAGILPCITLLLLAVGVGFISLINRGPTAVHAEEPAAEPDRSPVDVVLTADGKSLLTANQSSGTVSLVKLESGEVAAEVPCGKRPSAIALTPDDKHVLVTATFSGELHIFDLEQGKLKPAGKLHLGFEPRGIAVSPDGKLAYVALTTANAVAVVDVANLSVLDRIAVGAWPRYLALTPDGKRLGGRRQRRRRSGSRGYGRTQAALQGRICRLEPRADGRWQQTASTCTSRGWSYRPQSDHDEQHSPGVGARQPGGAGSHRSACPP